MSLNQPLYSQEFSIMGGKMFKREQRSKVFKRNCIKITTKLKGVGLLGSLCGSEIVKREKQQDGPPLSVMSEAANKMNKA